RRGLADVLRDTGREREALDAYQETLDGAPCFAEVLYAYGNLLWRRDRRADAIEQFQKLAECDPSRDTSQLTVARALAAANRPDEAAAAFERACVTCPGSTRVLSAFARFLSTHPSDAVRDADRAVQFAERARDATGRLDLRIVEALVCAYLEAERYDDAETLLRQAAGTLPPGSLAALDEWSSRVERRAPLRAPPRFP
ncbi:MAG: tetratricopeptide repeat protein, partial [Phycisphaerae bacterium]